MAYLCWRTITGRNDTIQLHMQVPYHGKSLVDAGFAFVKRLYRRSEVDSMRQLASVVCKSSVGNEVVLFGSEDGVWYDWKGFTAEYFRPFRGIRKYRHFSFESSNPGT